MRTLRNMLWIAMICGLVCPLVAAPIGGCWDSSDPTFEAGTWQELFAGGGEGQPGNVISASAAAWELNDAVLSSHEWISETPTSSMHKTIYTGGTLLLKTGGPWETAGDVLPYEVALGDLVVYTTKVYDANGLVTQLIWNIESKGTLAECESFKVDISAGYAGVPTPVMDGQTIAGMTDAIDSVEICIELKGHLRVEPETLNLKSKGNWIVAFLRFDDCIDLANVNTASLLLNGTLAPQKCVIVAHNDCPSVMMMKFSRPDLEKIITAGMVKLTLTGALNDGTEFTASDTIRVIEKPKPKPKPEPNPKPNKPNNGKNGK